MTTSSISEHHELVEYNMVTGITTLVVDWDHAG